MRTLAGLFIFTAMLFDKKPLTIAGQIAQLEGRGLILTIREKLLIIYQTLVTTDLVLIGIPYWKFLKGIIFSNKIHLFKQ